MSISYLTFVSVWYHYSNAKCEAACTHIHPSPSILSFLAYHICTTVVKSSTSFSFSAPCRMMCQWQPVPLAKSRGRLWVQGPDKLVSQVCSQLRSTAVFPRGWPVSSGLATGDKGDKHRGHQEGKIAQTQQGKQRAKRLWYSCVALKCRGSDPYELDMLFSKAKFFWLGEQVKG